MFIRRKITFIAIVMSVCFISVLTGAQNIPLKILRVKTQKVNDISAKVSIILNQAAQAQVEYGKSKKYGKKSTKETSFKYDKHTMTLSRLSPLTAYHYRVRAWDKQGKVVVSRDMMFWTSKAQARCKYDFIVKVGDMAPDFTIQYLDKKKKPIKLSSLRGNVVLLQFTASWCSVCHFAMPHLEKDIWQKFKKKKFKLIGIDRREKPDVIKAFIQKTGVTYPLAMDTKGAIFNLYAKPRAGITRNVLIDKRGKIVFITRLYRKKEYKKLIRKIDSLLPFMLY